MHPVIECRSFSFLSRGRLLMIPAIPGISKPFRFRVGGPAAHRFAVFYLIFTFRMRSEPYFMKNLFFRYFLSNLPRARARDLGRNSTMRMLSEW